MITEAELWMNGFKEYSPSHWRSSAVRSFQKCVRRDGVKRYFIQIHQYQPHENGKDWNFEADAQFNTGDQTFNALLLSPNTVTEVVEFFERLFTSMNCENYG